MKSFQEVDLALTSAVHGNAGHVGQGWRPDTYRALASADNTNTHVLTFDYRGFGYSTGSPSEAGLITDGIAAVDWVLNVAQIPPERVVLVGQSLGTGVATAVAEHFSIERKIDFAGVVLVAAFESIPTLMLTYSIGNFIPVLSPLRSYPYIQNFFVQRIWETWKSKDRIANWAKKSKKFNVALIHTKSDFDIPWKHSEQLFYAAANGTSEKALTLREIYDRRDHLDLGNDVYVDSWTMPTGDGGAKRISATIVRHGGRFRNAPVLVEAY
jgi:abhydrolase domain-containing protein 12